MVDDNEDVPRQTRTGPFTSKQCEALAARLDKRLGATFPAEVPRRNTSQGPLSFAQERLWFFSLFAKESPTYNEGSIIHLKGGVDAVALEQAILAVLVRHEVLRSTIDQTAQTQQAYQCVQALPAQIIKHVDLSCFGEEERRRELHRVCQITLDLCFDLTKELPCRFTLFKLDEYQHAFLFVNHHIVSDAWSRNLLIRELVAAYVAHKDTQFIFLNQLPIQYADFACWERALPQQPAIDAAIAKNVARLAPVPPPLRIGCGRAVDDLNQKRGTLHLFNLSKDLATQVHQLAIALRVTPFAVLLSAFGVLLYAKTRQPRFLIGTPYANRNKPETETLIGFFVNYLVLRCDLNEVTSFTQIVQTQHSDMCAAIDTSIAPLQKIVQQSKPKRLRGSHPLFQIMFVLQNTPRIDLELPGLEIEFQHLHTGMSRLDLTLELLPLGDESYAAQFEYDISRFSAVEILQMAEDYVAIVDRCCRQPDVKIANHIAFDVQEFLAEQQAPLRSALSYSSRANEFTQKIPALSWHVAKECLLEIVTKSVNLPIEQNLNLNFFELGGHSMLAVSVWLQIQKILGVEFPLRMLLEAETMNAFIAQIARLYGVVQVDDVVL